MERHVIVLDVIRKKNRASDGDFEMVLIRQANGATSRTYQVDERESSDATGHGRFVFRTRDPKVWRWRSHLGSGVSALGRTAEEAERLLRSEFWREAA